MMLSTAMVLAAGFGTRFREVSGDLPKPLVPVAGKPLIDWTLDGLAAAGVQTAVVNIHYKADLIEAHVAKRAEPKILIADERPEPLETGGGLVNASPLLGRDAVFCSNTDAIFDPAIPYPAQMLVEAWDANSMDALLLLVPIDRATGYKGRGDFGLSKGRQIDPHADENRLIFTGLQIIHPRIWDGVAPGPRSTREFWDAARARGRAFGVVYDGRWMHVGDPEGYQAAVTYLDALA